MKNRYKKHKIGTGKAPIRHTHRTAAGIEDALAVLIDVEMDLEALMLRTARAAEILRLVRAGPHEYDPERPAGLRIKIKRS